MDEQPEELAKQDAAFYEELLGIRTQGEQVERDIASPNSTLNAMMDKALDLAMDAAHNLLASDLITDAGITKARHHQAEAIRYLDMKQWIEGFLQDGGEAAQQFYQDNKDQMDMVETEDETYYDDE